MLYEKLNFDKHISKESYILIRNVMIILFVIVAMAMIYRIGLDNGAERATDSINTWLDQYNVYLVEKKETNGMTFQMGSGKGIMNFDNSILVKYEYDDGQLDLSYYDGNK